MGMALCTTEALIEPARCGQVTAVEGDERGTRGLRPVVVRRGHHGPRRHSAHQQRQTPTQRVAQRLRGRSTVLNAGRLIRPHKVQGIARHRAG